MKIVYAAIKAASKPLRGEPIQVAVRSGAEEEGHSSQVLQRERQGKSSREARGQESRSRPAGDGLRLDLAMLIDGLEDRREREVMRLSEGDYDYPEIAAKLGISFENVRGLVERAREALLKRLGIDQAKLIDGLEDPRKRAVMRLAAMKYKHEKIAAELGISKEQVQSDAKQARKVLQDRLRWVLLKRLRLVA